MALFGKTNWYLSTKNKTFCAKWALMGRASFLFPYFFGKKNLTEKGENALFYCFGQSFLFSVSFFIGNKGSCFHWHFLRWKKFLWKIIGVFQLPTYESPINANPAAEAINPFFLLCEAVLKSMEQSTFDSKNDYKISSQLGKKTAQDCYDTGN